MRKAMPIFLPTHLNRPYRIYSQEIPLPGKWKPIHVAPSANNLILSDDDDEDAGIVLCV